MTTLRKLITDKIITHLLDSRFYADYLRDYSDSWIAHNVTVEALHKLSDAMLVAVFTKLLNGTEIVPYHTDETGDFVNIKVGKYYGGMSGDGSIHT